MVWVNSSYIRVNFNLSSNCKETINVYPIPASEYKNVAQITANDSVDIDSDENNDDGDQSEDDEDSETITIQIADLSLAKTINHPHPNVGDIITFTVTVKNDGPNNATNVGIEDILPSGYTFVDNSASGNGTYDSTNRKISWMNFNVVNGEVVNLQYRVVVNEPSAIPIPIDEYKNTRLK